MARDDKIVRDYFQRFAGLLDRSSIVQDRSELRLRVESRQVSAGSLTRAWDQPNGIRFVDGSCLSFIENLAIENDRLVKIGYTYRFTSRDGGFTFRYDKDGRFGNRDVRQTPDGREEWHPLNHLHFQNREEPRYKTHEATLEEILTFIRLCFLNT